MGAQIPDSVSRVFIPREVMALPDAARGKVRDTYDFGGQLLIVATDRISAFDVVMPNEIPDKGIMLTALSLHWLGVFGSRIPNHLITANVAQFPQQVRPFADALRGRSMLVKLASVIPFECIARGYITGSAWKEYRDTQSVCGIGLPSGLRECDKLERSIFTPTTKAETGHDQNLTYAELVRAVGEETARDLRDKTLRLYDLAAEYALERGVIIADTKFEFGRLPDGELILVDEVLTPDSSRFWPKDEYEPGHDQPSFDKQFVRNYLVAQGWNKTPPAPALPQQVVDGTRKRYIEACKLLTGTNPVAW